MLTLHAKASKDARTRVTKTPSHLFASSEGALYDTRAPSWNSRPPLRKDYSAHHGLIRTLSQLKATLRAGGYAWPGGYPLYFVTADGAALSFDTVRSEFRAVVDAFATRAVDWRIVACDANWEDTALHDAHTGELIPCAYGEG